ncbi:MAG: hypothetical protein GY847_34920 [Proteobacteria bacterium]|nr:hypothetical protein [Pseudomonadota bacterium]
MKKYSLACGVCSPYVCELLVPFVIQFFEQRNEVQSTRFIYFEVAKIPNSANIDPTILIFGQRSGRTLLGRLDESPTATVILENTVTICEVHDSTIVLNYGSILWMSVIFHMIVMRHQREAFVGLPPRRRGGNLRQ